MKRAVVTALVVVFVLSSLAEAGRKDDFDFAQGLVERKFYDLAREEFEAIVNDSSRSVEERAAGELGLALLLKAQSLDAQQNPKMETTDVIALFDEAEGRFDRFLDQYPNHPKILEARFEVAGLLQAKGNFLAGRMKSEPEQKAAYLPTAEEAYSQALDIFKEVGDQYSSRADDARGAEQEEFSWLAARAYFFHGVSYYYKGILYDTNSAERSGALEKTIEFLLDFVWENEDNILGGYAYLYLGLAKKGLEEPDEALEYLSVAASNYPVPDPNQYPLEYRKWTDLYFQGYYKLAEYCNELKMTAGTEYRDTAIAAITGPDGMLERLPDALERKFGQLALLQLARAYKGIGESDKALEWATKVSQRGEELKDSTEWGAATAYMANQLINEIIVDDPETEQPPNVLLKAASGRKAAREWGQAVRAFQAVIRSAMKKGEEAIKKFVIPAWISIGECYYRDGRYLEAYFAYDYLVKNFESVDREAAGDAAYFRYRSATALHSETRDKADEELKKKARSEFAEKFKDHPRSIDLQYYEGADYISDADSRAQEKGPAAEADARRLYGDAQKRLRNVKRTSILYAKAMAREGEVLYKLGMYEEALKKFDAVEKYIKDPKNVTTDQQQMVNRLQARAIATYWGAQALAKMDKWEDALKRLEGYEKEFSDENVRDFHTPVMFDRARALIELGRLEDAEKQAIALREKDEENGRVPIIFYLLGQAFAKKAEPLKETDEAGWRANLSKAVEHLAYYISRKTTPSARDWQTIGNWSYQLKEWEQAGEFLGKALALLNEQLDRTKAKTPEREELVKRIEGISVMLSEILLTEGKFAQAVTVFEDLLIPDKGARTRVLELLTMQMHSRVELKELMDKMRAVPSFMEGLAKAYLGIGSQDSILRALTLLGILSNADKKDKFTEKWWMYQYMIVKAYLDYGIAFKDQAALNNVIVKVRQWDGLGVLENSAYRDQIRAVERKANQEMARIGR